MNTLPAHRVSSRRVYDGKLVKVDTDTVRAPSGVEFDLEIIRHPGAAAVVPLLSDPGSEDPVVLLIEQFRYAAGGEIWEIPAGVLEPGESPEACAHRELREETGVSAERMEPLTTICTTPGFTDERIHLFVAEGLTPGKAAPERDEFIKVTPHPMTRVLQMIRDGEIVDAKSIAALLFVAGFRLGL